MKGEAEVVRGKGNCGWAHGAVEAGIFDQQDMVGNIFLLPLQPVFAKE
jgi:hypothetical protein